MYVYIYGLYYIDYMNYKPLTNDAHGMNPKFFFNIPNVNGMLYTTIK